jgi:hypothetical protein
VKDFFILNERRIENKSRKLKGVNTPSSSYKNRGALEDTNKKQRCGNTSVNEKRWLTDK